MSSIPPYPPQQIGEFWVLPAIDQASDNIVKLHVSVAVSEFSNLQDSDLQVQVIAGGQSLAMTMGPVPGLLPTLHLMSVNAFGLFQFDNPGNPLPTTVIVILRGQSASFDIPGNV
jgi:hypothetical protein